MEGTSDTRALSFSHCWIMSRGHLYIGRRPLADKTASSSDTVHRPAINLFSVLEEVLFYESGGAQHLSCP